ncbi:MAG: phosphatase PAP2 family protein [Patescibacteria group bacterium]|nr:phosphatase PAP2 family protein [Patescibacteria group bacterium]
MIQKLLTIDETITKLLFNLFPHNSFFNYLFSFFSLKGVSLAIWILIIIISLFFEEKKNPGISDKDKKFIVYFTLSLLITTLLVNFGIKNIIRRPRPFFSLQSLSFLKQKTNFNDWQKIKTNYHCPSDFSFPSSHAAISFVAATTLSIFDKKRRFFYYFVAFLISYSRIYLGCHYFLDVFFGGLIGFSIAYIFRALKKFN